MVVELDELYPNLEIIHLHQSNNLNKIKTLLEFNYDDKVNAASEKIFNYLIEKSETVLIEKNYLDTETVDAYSKYYSRAFKKYKRECKRLFFFSKKITLKDIYGYEKDDESKELIFNKKLHRKIKSSDNYLGFLVLREIRPKTISRTYLNLKSENPNDYILCGGTTEANCFGINLKVRSAPFIQQDQRVSACATAAAWVCIEALSNRFGGIKTTTAKITEIANSISMSGRAFPTEGLDVKQINCVLTSLGYHAISYETDEIKDIRDMKRVIYSYIESNIPIVLAIKVTKFVDNIAKHKEVNEEAASKLEDSEEGGLHAIAIVGHGLENNDNPKIVSDELNYYSSTEWIPYFIINDDQLGPYRYLRFIKDENLEGSLSYKLEISNDYNFKSIDLEGMPRAIVIPHPSSAIYTSGMHAEAKAFKVFEEAKKAYELAREEDNTIPKLDIPEIITFRTYLVSSNEFKRFLHERKGISPEIIARYRGKKMPKFIWLAELCQDFNNHIYEEKYTYGEIIIDPTSNPQELDFISIHLPNIFFEWPDNNNLKIALQEFRILENDEKYLLRKQCLY